MSTQILLIGPTSDQNTNRIGGITIPFEEFCKWCITNKSYNYSISIAKLTGKNKFQIILSYIKALYKVIKFNDREIIILNATWRSLIFFSLFLLLSKKISKKEFVIRKFAGNFDHYFDKSNFLIKFLIKYTIKSSLITYFETIYLKKWALKYNLKTKWWPNSRIKNLETPHTANYSDLIKLIFIGNITPEKGIDKLFNLHSLHNKFNIDLYGKIHDQIYLKKTLLHSNIKYKGILNRKNIYKELSKADALILPTEWDAEGYPGVIIEASLVGTPSICSNSRGPVELINILKSGFIIDFSNNKNFSDTLKKIKLLRHTNNRQILSKKAHYFNSHNIYNIKFNEIIKNYVKLR